MRTILRTLVVLSCILLGLPTVAQIEWGHFHGTIVDSNGLPIASAEVNVFETGTTTPATIASDDTGTSKPNPFTADLRGNYEFWAQGDTYDLVFKKNAATVAQLLETQIGPPFALLDCVGSELVKRNAGDTAWECATDAGGAGDTHPINDSTAIVKDPADATKLLRVDVGANATGVTGVLASAFTTAETVTLPDATDTLVGKATTDTLTNKTLDGGLATTTHAAGADIIQGLRHATDCTAITDGKDGERCYEQDSESIFVCEPTAGDCDTGAEWRPLTAGNADTLDGLDSLAFLKADSTVTGTGTQTFSSATPLDLTGTDPLIRWGTAIASPNLTFKGRDTSAGFVAFESADGLSRVSILTQDIGAATELRGELGQLSINSTAGTLNLQSNNAPVGSDTVIRAEDQIALVPGSEVQISGDLLFFRFANGTIRWDGYLIGNLPAAGTKGRWAVITDGVDETDCVTGGGSTALPCLDDGTVWAPAGGGGSEINALVVDGISGIADDQLPVGTGGGTAAYQTLPNGAVAYDTTGGTFSQADLADLGDVTATTGTGSTVVFDTSASVSAITLNGTTVLNGNIDAGLNKNWQHDAAGTPTLTIENVGAGPGAELRVEGDIGFQDSTAFAVVFDATPTAGRVWTFQDTTDTVVGLATMDVLANKTLTTPTIDSGSGWTNANHNHTNAARAGTLTDSTATPTAFHDDTISEIFALTNKAAPVSADLLLIEDSAASNAKKKILWSAVEAIAGNDADAIHDNVDGEINAVALKASPVGADVLLIEDSAASFAKKKITITSLPAGGEINDLVGDGISGIADDQLAVGTGGGAAAYQTLPNGRVAYSTASGTFSLAPFPSWGQILDNIGNVNMDLQGAGGDRTLTVTNSEAFDAHVDVDGLFRFRNGTAFTMTFDGTPTAARIWTFQNASDTVVGLATTDVLSNKTLSGPTITAADWTTANHNHEDASRAGTLASAATPTAIHDDVANEFSGITSKAVPVSADLLIIEDSAAANAKKKILWSAIEAIAGSDADAIHDNVASEISAITAKGTPVTGDFLIIEDSAAANVKKSITMGDIDHDALSNFLSAEHVDWAGASAGTIHTDNYIEGGDGTDGTAIHDNVNGEINAVAVKGSPVGADVILIEDSAASFAKKKVAISSLPGGSEINALVADGISGIADDQLAVGTGAGSAAYQTLANGAVSYATATGLFTQAALAGLSDVSDTTGTGSTVVLDTSPTIVTPTIGDFSNATHDHVTVGGGNPIALGAATTGDYVDGITASQGLLKTGTEGADLGLIDCAATEILKRNVGDSAWECATDAGGAGDTHPIDDTTAIVQDPGDNTKLLRMDVGANTTGITGIIATAFTTAKTVTIPDATDTLVGKATTDTLENKTLGATTLAGNLTRAADQTIDLTGAATRTLTIENSTASQQADVNIDGDLTLSNVNPVVSWSDDSIAVPRLTFSGSSTAANNTVEYQFDNLGSGGVGEFRFQIADTATLFNSSDLALFFADGFLFAAGSGNVEFQSAIGGEALFNQAGDDRDFRVETDGAEHMIFAEGGTDRVGINKALPGVTLDVGGSVNVDNTLTFKNGTAFTVEFGVTPTANRTMTLPDANATLVGETLTQTLTNKTISGGLATTTHAAGANFMQTLRHATDCTTITDGKDGEVCYEQDADALFVCEPTAGDCDTAAEWRATGGGGSGDVTDVGDCGGPDCFTATGTGNALTFEGATPDAFESILDAEDPTVGVGTWRLADQAGATTRFLAGDTSKLLELDGDGLAVNGTTLELDEAFGPTWTDNHLWQVVDTAAAITLEGTTASGLSPILQMTTDNPAERTLIQTDGVGNLTFRNGTPGADFQFDTNATAGSQDFTVVDGDINLSLSGALVDTIDVSAHTHNGGGGGAAVSYADLAGDHVLATGTALGPDHTMSGAAAGEVLRALSATTAAFDALALADLSDVTGTTGSGSTLVFDTSPAIVTPTIASFTNATHDHIDAAGGGTLTKTRSKSWNLFDPATADSDKIQWAPPKAITITKVWCSTDAGTVTLMPDERAEATPNTQGTDILSAGLVCDTTSQSSCASGCDVNTISNGGIDAYDPVSWDIDAVSTATFLRVHVEYTVVD